MDITLKESNSNILKIELERRRESNSTYSVRALARDLGIGKTTIAEVIVGKRKLSKMNAQKVAEKLKLSLEQMKELTN